MRYGMMLGVVLVTLCIALIALVSGWRVRSTGEFTVTWLLLAVALARKVSLRIALVAAR